MEKRAALLSQLQRAAARLGEALALPVDDIVRDSAIQRFEFTYELAWKLMQAELKSRGVRCDSPFDCIKNSAKVKLVDEDDAWVELVELRNLTSHVYSERMAKDIYEQLPRAQTLFDALIERATRAQH